jgi:hypothetical protein
MGYNQGKPSKGSNKNNNNIVFAFVGANTITINELNCKLEDYKSKVTSLHVTPMFPPTCKYNYNLTKYCGRLIMCEFWI